MRAVIKTHYDDEPKVIYAANPKDGFFLECEVTDPPSMKGRTFFLYVDVPMTTKLLLTLRDQGIRQRQ